MKIRELRELQDVLPRYDYTAKLGRDRWAWEYYRRDEEFQDIAHYYSASDDISRRDGPCRGVTCLKLRRSRPEAEVRGLSFFPNPSLDALAANVFWSSYVYPRQLFVQVVEAAPGTIDQHLMMALQRCTITHFTGFHGKEQFILRGAGCAVQIRAEGVSLLSSDPHKMQIAIDDHEDLDEKMEIVKRARKVYGDHDEGPPVWSKRGLELRNALICLDAKAAGLSYWEMAEIIHGRDHVAMVRMKGSRALKDSMRRHLLRGIELRDGGFRKMLVPKTILSSVAA